MSQRRQKRNFIDENSINKNLICAICQEVFYKPVLVSCGHSFCKPCIIHWKYKKKDQCPLCMKIMDSKDKELLAIKQLIVESIIGELEVFCFHLNSCDWKGQLQNLGSHLKKCEVQQENEVQKSFDNHEGIITIDDEKQKNEVQITDDDVFSVATTQIQEQQNDIQNQLPQANLNFLPFVNPLLNLPLINMNFNQIYNNNYSNSNNSNNIEQIFENCQNEKEKLSDLSDMDVNDSNMIEEHKSSDKQQKQESSQSELSDLYNYQNRSSKRQKKSTTMQSQSKKKVQKRKSKSNNNDDSNYTYGSVKKHKIQ